MLIAPMNYIIKIYYAVLLFKPSKDNFTVAPTPGPLWHHLAKLNNTPIDTRHCLIQFQLSIREF